MQPTNEQYQAQSAFAQRFALRLIAYAGAGKTTTLVGMAKARPHDRGLYIAFNRAIADDAKAKFLNTGVMARTAHSLAYSEIKSQFGYDDTKMGNNLTTRMLRDYRLEVMGQRFNPLQPIGPLDAGTVGQLVLGTVRNFCQSDDPQITTRHVPRIAKAFEPELLGQIRNHVSVVAAWVWNFQVERDHALPLGHDGYLKIWCARRPRLDSMFNFIMVDEAQDLNPVLIGLVADQRTQLVSVGDSHQQIYAWRGAVDALQRLPGHEMRLTQSFRFGDAIAQFASALLFAMGERLPCLGNGRECAIVDQLPDHYTNAILCRTNSGLIEVLANQIAAGRRAYVAGGTVELQRLVDDAERLQGGKPAQTAELIGFTTWAEVVEHSDTEEGRSLQVLVNLVSSRGCGELRRLLQSAAPSAQAAEITLSTAHKAKGLEWERVKIHEDFMRTIERATLEERRLFYVACTRAKTVLCVSDDIASIFTRPMEQY